MDSAPASRKLFLHSNDLSQSESRSENSGWTLIPLRNRSVNILTPVVKYIGEISSGFIRPTAISKR